MPNIFPESPRNDYTIAGETFSIPAPYEPGHALTPGEASQLNQVFAENIRNNLAARVAALKESGAFDAVEFQATVDDYCDSYEMGVRTGGGGRVSDPVQVRAMEIAKDLVKAAIRKQGIQLSNVSASQITEKAKSVIGSNPKILELARAQVEANKALAAVELDSLPTGEDSSEAEAPKGKRAKAAA